MRTAEKDTEHFMRCLVNKLFIQGGTVGQLLMHLVNLDLLAQTILVNIRVQSIYFEFQAPRKETTRIIAPPICVVCLSTANKI